MALLASEGVPVHACSVGSWSKVKNLVTGKKGKDLSVHAFQKTFAVRLIDNNIITEETREQQKKEEQNFAKGSGLHPHTLLLTIHKWRSHL